MLGSSPVSSNAIGWTAPDVSITKARASQTVAEVLRTGTAVKARASQTVAEVLRTNTAVKIRASQTVIEILRQNNAPVPFSAAQPILIIVT
ncbi:MAG: hypothetical protein DMF06_14330 [Verrucomicrobia bacterium]|nr:MAG: hypothetical protein DMF06_14330 [Verrucomicrobiota bacterium]